MSNSQVRVPGEAAPVGQGIGKDGSTMTKLEPRTWDVEVEVTTWRRVAVKAPTRLEAMQAGEAAVQAIVEPTAVGGCFVRAKSASLGSLVVQTLGGTGMYTEKFVPKGEKP